jgi:hypothetical protein
MSFTRAGDANQSSERIGLQLKRLQLTINHIGDWCFTTDKQCLNTDGFSELTRFTRYVALGPHRWLHLSLRALPIA